MRLLYTRQLHAIIIHFVISDVNLIDNYLLVALLLNESSLHCSSDNARLHFTRSIKISSFSI